MSYLNNLLKGVTVEWLALGEITDILTGGEPPSNCVKGSSPTDIYKYPIYGNGIEVYGFTDSYRIEKDAVTISSIGSNTGSIYFRKAYFTPIIRLKVVIPKYDSLLPRFIYHCLTSIKISSKKSSVPNMSAADVKKIKIPIPFPENKKKSLEIQQEIVRILDTFNELTTELTTALTTELTVRNQQFSYYRKQLLSFDDGKVEWKSLGEVAEYSKERIVFDKLDKNNYVGVDNLLQNCEGKTISNYVPQFGNSTRYNTNDILIGNIRPYLKKIWLADRIGGTNGDVLVIHPTDKNISSGFLYQILADDSFFEYNMQHAKGAKMPRGNKDKILDYRFPVPSLEEQNRIVSILDKFEILTNSINQSLPKEIELRKKQYEYYRDLLLTFPKDN